MKPAKKQLVIQFLITVVVYFVLQLLLSEAEGGTLNYLKAALSAVVFAVLSGITTFLILRKYPPKGKDSRSGSTRGDA